MNNDQPFVVGGERLMHPGDGSFGASAGNIVNCRCTSAGVVDLEGPRTPAPKPAKPPKVRKAQTVAEAEEIARELNLADAVSYKGLRVSVANAMNAQLAHHLKLAPKLREQLKFVGSTQARDEFYVEEQLRRWERDMRDSGMSAEAIARERPNMERHFRDQIRDPFPEAYAQSWPTNSTVGRVIGGISVNDQWGRMPMAWESRLQGDVAENWHPIGTGNMKAVIDHEIGHQLDDLLHLATHGGIIDTELYRALGGAPTRAATIAGLSRYAAENPREFIAEAWAEFLNNPEPRHFARIVGEYILSRLKRRK